MFRIRTSPVWAAPLSLMDVTPRANTVLPMDVRILKRPSLGPSAGIIACSVSIQLVLERYAKPVARLLRAPLMLWVMSASYAGLGVQALLCGPWVLVNGRLLQRASLVAVLESRRPSVVAPRRSGVYLATSRGFRVPVEVDAQVLAEFLGLPVRSLES
jgi:hypothetical protein